MLTNPASPLVRHRLQHDVRPAADRLRLAQVRRDTADRYGLWPAAADPCPWCANAEIVASAVAGRRPVHNVDIDQCYLDARSLARRLRAICQSRPVHESRVAFVGDDDHASIALMRMNPPDNILVLDIDLRVVNAVRAAAWQLGLDKRTAVVHIDLADRAAVEAVLDDYGDSYDVVVTDPPYAHDGMLCFVSVAASLAAVGGEIQVAVPAVLAEAWTDELMREVQGFLCDNGFVLDRVEPGVFTYETSDVVSSLVTARRLVGAPAPSRWDWSDRFYTTRTLPSQPTA